MTCRACPWCGREPVTERTTTRERGTVFVTRCPRGCLTMPDCRTYDASRFLWNRETEFYRRN